MQYLLVLLLAGFPAIATRVSTRRGGRALAGWTSAVLGMILLAGLALASPRFGNRLADTNGYGSIAAQILLMLGLSIAIPVVLSAGAIHLATRAGLRPSLIFTAGLGVALCGWGLGILLMFGVS